MEFDWTEVIAIAGVAGVVVGGLGVAAGWLSRNRSIRWQLVLVALVAIGTMLAGVLGVANRMMVSDPYVEVVTLMGLSAAVASLLVVAVVSTAVGRWSAALRDQARTVGTVDPGDAASRAATVGPREFTELSRELEATNQRLTESRLREQRLEASRRELVSWVSHDLRTPLAGMRAMTEALEDGMAPDPGRYHRQIRGEVDRMVRMVDDLFELSRIQAGVFPVNRQPTSIGDVVSEAIAGVDAVAAQRGVRVTGDVPGGLEAEVDPGGLARVVSNLLMNAVRHTPAGGTVVVSAAGESDQFLLRVADECDGIPEADRARVFDVAWKAEDARTPDAPDGEQFPTARAGLGLAIVKGIVEGHDGSVAVTERTDLDRGCVFEVVLPTRRDDSSGRTGVRRSVVSTTG